MSEKRFLVYCIHKLRPPKIYKSRSWALKKLHIDKNFSLLEFSKEVQAEKQYEKRREEYKIGIKEQKLEVLASNLAQVKMPLALDGSSNSDQISDEERSIREEFINKIFGKFQPFGSTYRFTSSKIVSFCKFTHDGYFDGASRGNPGPGSIGYALRYSQSTIFTKGLFVPQKITNNQAQIFALSHLLAQSYCNNIRSLRVHGDSKLAINFMNGAYQVKSQNILSLVDGCKEIASKFQKVTYRHIDRNLNKIADTAAEDALVAEGYKRKRGKKLG